MQISRTGTTAGHTRLALMLHTLLTGVALTCSTAFAQAQLPEGPVKLVVPTTPGSTPDIIARALAPRLSERLGRPVVVENKVGASGNIGAEAVAHAAPNGSTVLIAASTIATGASLQASASFNAIRDLEPITLAGWNRLVLVTHAKSGFANIGEFIAAAKRSPGKLNYGSPGNGTPNHLSAELFKLKTGTHIVHIPYRGSGPQLADLLAGQVEMAPLTIIAAAPHVRSGRLVALALTGDKRSPLLPGVPALSEANVPGVQGDIWYGVFGPKGMSPELVARWNTEVRDLLRGEEKAFANQGIDVETGSPGDLRQLLARDTARWAELIKAQGIKAE